MHDRRERLTPGDEDRRGGGAEVPLWGRKLPSSVPPPHPPRKNNREKCRRTNAASQTKREEEIRKASFRLSLYLFLRKDADAKIFIIARNCVCQEESVSKLKARTGGGAG